MTFVDIKKKEDFYDLCAARLGGPLVILKEIDSVLIGMGQAPTEH